MSIRIILTVGILLLIFPGFRGKTGMPDRETPADSVFYFKGRILDSLTRQPLAFTHIINTNRNTATICDTLGYFFIRVRVKDTLHMSNIGYAPVEIVVSDSLRELDRVTDFLLQSISYSIREVMINPLGSYANFRNRVIHLELPPSEFEIHPSVLADIELGIDTLDMMPVPAMSPITALYNWLSREGRSRRKLAELIEQERFEKEIAYKYSPLIVSGITGYTGMELNVFMDFCNFHKKFLREADQYDIRDAVLEKQKIYEAQKEELYK